MALIEGALLNDRALQRALKDLPEKLQKRALRQSLREKGKEIFKDAQKNAREISPRLARTMKLRAAKTKRRGNVGVVIFTGTREELNIPASDRYYWPAAQELGTKFLRPRAFMRRANKKHEPTALEDVAKIMRNQVSSVIAVEIRRQIGG